jgi:hypothetical protein
VACSMGRFVTASNGSTERHCTDATKTLVFRAVAQGVSRRVLTAAVRVRAGVKSCGICGGQSGNGAGFLTVLRFVLPLLHNHQHLSSTAGEIGQ